MKKLSLVKELMPDIAKIVSSLAEELPNMSPQEQRKALVTIRRLKNTQSTTGKTKKIPTTDDELWERIRDEVGDEIPRVAVCDDHDAPFDFVADYYFERKRAILVMANREGGKCITGDSLIYDPITGLRTSIDEVIDNPYIKNITSMNKNGDVVICDISSKWDMGEKECLKIKLSSGRDIIVTPEHPFMIQDGWYKADEIEIGDAVATPSFLPFHLNTKEIPKSHLILISGLLAEGSINEADVNEKRGASFSSNDDYFIELMTDSAEDIGCEVSYASCYDYNIVKEKNSGKYNKIRNFLKNYEISCKLAKNKIIPDIIYEINEKQLCEFLSIFWMCDGYVTEKEAGICLASKQMVYDIQHLLLKLGIQSRIRYKISKYDGKEFDSWALSVYGNHIEYFYEKMDLWDYKKDRLEDLVNKNRCPSAGRPPLTDMMIEELRKKCPRRNSWDFSYKTRNTEAYNQLGWKVEKGFGVSALNRGKVKNLQARRLRALCHARDLNEKEFSVLLNEDLWWDFVVNIEKVGMKKVYDLTINDTHTFVANDIIVHNTKSVNIANYLNCEDKPGCEVCVFADIEAQSNKSYNYVKSFIYTKNKDGKKIPKSTIDGDPLRKETRWKSGSKLEVIIASKSGVNSPHPHKVHADEIDLMDREIWDESRSMASTGRGSDGKTIKSQDIATSTRKSTRGLMQEIIQESEKAIKLGLEPSWWTYKFCIFECAKEVPNCSCAPVDKRETRLQELGKNPKELCRCKKIVKGEWSENVPRTLESVCKGKLFKSRGWMEYDDVIHKFSQNTPNVWVAQHECRRPMADGLYLPTWNRDRHTIKGYEPRPEYGLLWTGTDWGGTAASAVLWLQGPLHHSIEVKNNIGTTTVIPQGSYIFFKELYEAAMGSSRLAGKVIRQEIQYKNQFPGWRIKARFADMAGKQQRLDWREHNPPLRTVWYISREVDPMIECVQALVSDNLLYVDSVGCPNLCDDFESWRQKDGKEVHDDSTHGPAAGKYALKNVTTIIHRYSKVNSISPEPVVAARESPGNFLGAQAQEGVGSTSEFESGHWLNSFGPPERGDPWKP